MRLDTQAPVTGSDRKRASKLTHEAFRSPVAWKLLVAVVFFVFVALVLTIINRRIIAQASFEVGDFAANSLLIQDAKSLKLFKGNYSRVGFNHPGPAILYTLASGEVFFYDWTRIAPSPFAGQLIAVTIYSACWITLIGVMFWKLCKSPLATGLLLTVFLTISAFSQYQVFAGAWFPHLYYFPFALFTLALARFVCGRSDSLIPLAIGWGFLVNGHVAFFAITAIMLAGALIANQVFSRIIQRKTCLSWISWELLYVNRRKLLGSLAIVLLFLTPLVIETIVHFPGPVHDYLSYRASHNGNSLVSSLQFVSNYWFQGPTFLTSIWGMLLVGLLYVSANGEEYFPDMLGMLTALLFATAGLLFYAKTGIDDLSYTYVGLFYYSVPALGVATVGYCLYRKFGFAGKQVLAWVAIGVGLSSTYNWARRPSEYAVLYNQPEIPVLFEKMRVLGPLPLVLDLDNSRDWGYVWSTILGAEAYAKRAGVQLFCVNTNWHISFTSEARCTDTMVQTANRFIVSRSDPSPRSLRPILDYFGLSFYRFEPPVISSKQELPVSSNKLIYGRYVLGKGWSSPEEDFVWSVGKESELVLRIDSQVKRIHLDLAAFLPSQNSSQQIAVQVNDVPVGNFIFTTDANKGVRTVDVPRDGTSLIKMKLLVSKPTSPLEAKMSGDPRMLGVALYGIGTE